LFRRSVTNSTVNDSVVQSEVQVSSALVKADHVAGYNNIGILLHSYFSRDQSRIRPLRSRTATTRISSLISDNGLKSRGWVFFAQFGAVVGVP